MSEERFRANASAFYAANAPAAIAAWHIVSLCHLVLGLASVGDVLRR